MNIIETVSLALRSLRSNNLRTFLSVLGVMVGVGAVISVISVGMSAQAEIARNISDLGTNIVSVLPNFRDSASQSRLLQMMNVGLGREMLEAVPALSSVSAVAQVEATLAVGGDTARATLMGVEPSYSKIIPTDTAFGRWLVIADLSVHSQVIVLSSSIASELFRGIDPVGKQVWVTAGERRRPFVVVGVTEAEEDEPASGAGRQAFIPVTTMVYRLLPARNVSMYLGQTRSASDTDAAVAQLRRFLSLKSVDPDAFEVSSQQALLDAMKKVTIIVTSMLTVIAGISLVVSGLGIMNTLLTAVAERTREIGVRKSLGARNDDIRAQFLVESVVLSSLGGMAGMALGYAGSMAVSKALNWPPAFNWLSVVTAMGFSTLIGLAFGVYPATRASSMDPVTALRCE